MNTLGKSVLVKNTDLLKGGGVSDDLDVGNDVDHLAEAVGPSGLDVAELALSGGKGDTDEFVTLAADDYVTTTLLGMFEPSTVGDSTSYDGSDSVSHVS